MPLDDHSWAEVRAAYEANERTVADIAAQFGITMKVLYQRRVAEQWPLRGVKPPFRKAPADPKPPAQKTPSQKSPSKTSPAKKATPAKKPSASTDAVRKQKLSTIASRAALIERLYNVINLKLTQLEQRMEAADPNASATDHERETRAIAGLIRNFEHVTEIHTDHNAGKSAASTAAVRSVARATAAIAATDGAGAATSTSSATAGALASLDAASAERLRRDIAQRLERILEKGNPPRDSGGSST